MKFLKKKIYLLPILVTIFIIYLFNSNNIVFAEDTEITIIDSGDCGKYGDNIKWELNSEGLLTLSGEGQMKNYTWTNYIPTTPWYQYSNKINRIIVGDGITSIGESAFMNLSNLEDVQISNDVISLKPWSFACSSKLKEIQLPENLKNIGSYCFNWSKGLLNISIPNSIESLGNSVFENCTNLQAIKLPENITYIPDYFFKECETIESVELPGKIKEIGESAFYDCKNLKTVKLSHELKNIKREAFSGCKSLNNIIIPDTVTSIGLAAFKNCSELTNLQLSNSITTISKELCYGCTKLTNINIPSSVNIVGECAFYECSSLKSIEIPPLVNKIEKSTFCNCFKLEDITLNDNLSIIEERAFSNCINLKNVMYGDKVTKIGTYAFYDCQNLKTIYIPKNITEIGNKAFGYSVDEYGKIGILQNAKAYVYAESVGEKYAIDNNLPYSIISIIVNDEECEYTGEEITPNIEITIDDKKLNLNEDYKVEFSNNINIGTATAMISFINYYEFINSTFKYNFEIGKILNKCEISLDKEDYQYHMILPRIIIMDNDKKLELNKDYEVSYTLAGETWKVTDSHEIKYAWDTGLCSIKITGIGDYIGNIEKQIEISKFDMSNVILTTYENNSMYGSIFNLEDYYYNGSEQKQIYYYVWDEYSRIDYSNYEIAYLNNTDVGIATMLIKGKGEHYTGIAKKEFHIFPHNIQDGGVEVKVESTEIEYTGSAIEAKLKMIDSYGNTLVENRDYKITYQDSDVINIGTVYAQIEGIGNYSGYITETFNIAKKLISNFKVEGITDKIFTQGEQIQNIVLKDGNNILQKDRDYTISYEDNIYPGVATMKITGTWNYTGTIYKNFKILVGKINNLKTKSQGKSDITIKWSKDNAVTGYQVYMTTSKNGNYKKIATIEDNRKTSYKIKKLKPGKTYYFKVRAYTRSDYTEDYHKVTNGMFSNILTTTTKTNTPVISIIKAKRKKITVKFKKVSGASGYQIQYSTDKKFKKNNKTVIASKNSTSKTISKLKSKKKCYVRIRAYRTVNGKKVYSSYSLVKNVKIK